jgi:hypothetical protein
VPIKYDVSATVDALLEHGPVDRVHDPMPPYPNPEVEPLRQWDHPENPRRAHENREIQIAWELLRLSAQELTEPGSRSVRDLAKELLTMHGVY